MIFLILTLACLAIGLVYIKNVFLWLALANVFNAMQGFANDKIIPFGISVALVIVFLLCHFIRNQSDGD